MMNLKLKVIASFVDQKDTVIDIGCDHAYLAIYLKKNNLAFDVYASDIHVNALNRAKKNIKEANLKITTYLSDGFKNINNEHIDTAVIAGMGADTIFNSIKNVRLHVKKIIISSNNHHALLRKALYHRKFYIKKEEVIYEKGKYYVIMLVTRNAIKENFLSLKYGKSKNKEYFLYLKKKEYDVLKKIPKRKIFKRIKHKKNLFDLNLVIKRI